MKFDRCARYEPMTMSARKVAAFERKKRREQERLPLFAEQIAGEQHGVDEELQARQRHSDSMEEALRALDARVWRESRRDYFSAAPDIREKIRQEWNAWRGPLKPQYFRYVVDKHTGVMEQRLIAIREKERQFRESLRIGSQLRIPV